MYATKRRQLCADAGAQRTMCRARELAPAAAAALARFIEPRPSQVARGLLSRETPSSTRPLAASRLKRVTRQLF